jgi:succinoglycan biosynthesis transport protein ExoP
MQETVQSMDERALAQNNTLTGLPRVRQPADEPARDWLLTGADELFRGLYTRAGVGFSPEVLIVSSAIAGEGKTTISLGLAATMAQDFPERRIVLVETDFQKPALASDFDVDAKPGLVECLTSASTLELALRGTYLDNLHLLPVGGPAPGRGRYLRSSNMATVIDTLRQTYDLVVIDAPAILVNSDAVMLTDLADGTIFVVRSGVTPQSMINRAFEQIDEQKLRGVVLNGSRTAIPGWLRRLCGL